MAIAPPTPQRQWLKITALALGLSAATWSNPAIATRTIAESLKTEPANLHLLQPDNVPTDGSIVTMRTMSQTEMTIPSLWWAQEQFGGKLLTHWMAYQGDDQTVRRVDLIINQPVWNAINYLQRYTFLNRFGTELREDGYNVRVLSVLDRRTDEVEVLGMYVCEPSTVAAVSPMGETDQCAIQDLTSTGRGAFGGRPRNSLLSR